MNPVLNHYGLKWNPFATSIPTEGLHIAPDTGHFCDRIERVLLREGGFALIHGEPGTGKSVTLRILADRLSHKNEIQTAIITHPQSTLADFYRELGDLFGISLKPNNRWGGFKQLRERWLSYIETTRLYPVILIDEAQEMPLATLSELRLMGSYQFDSKHLLCVIFAGDDRLYLKMQQDELQPLRSRIRVQLHTQALPHNNLLDYLKNILDKAGQPTLMTQELIHTVCEQSMGNYRALMQLCDELLIAGAQREKTQLDQNLYLELFAPPIRPTTRRSNRN